MSFLVGEPLERLTTIPLHLNPGGLFGGSGCQDWVGHNTSQPALELQVHLETRAGAAGLKFLFGKQEERILTFDPEENALLLRRRSNIKEAGFNSIHTAILKSPTNSLDLRIFLDWSSIEIFAEGGQTVFSELVYPSSHQLEIRAFGKGEASFRDVNVWLLDSIH